MAHTAAARTPPPGLTGLCPDWSRLITVPRTDGLGRTWHILDNQAPNPHLTLLCVHGNPSWSYLFRELLHSAPAGVRVLAVDQLEMGFSERSGRVRRLATRIDDLCDLTDEMGLQGPVITVAHDWGGPISLGWVLRHRQQCAGVILMNTAVHQPEGSPAPSLIRLVRSRPLLERVTVTSTAFIRGALEMSRPRLGAGVRHGFLAPYADATRRRAIGDFVADIPLSADHPSAASLDGIATGLASLHDLPALLLWGASDPIFSDLYLHDLEHRLPHADVHRYRRATHFVSEDADTTGAIIDWIGAGRDAGDPPDGEHTSTLLDTHGDLGSKAAIAEVPGPGDGICFAEFADLVEMTAAGLAGAGIQPGDRVALMIPPGIDLAVSLYACWRAGAVVVLIDAGLGPAGMSAAIKAAYPAHLIGIPRVLAAARTLRWPGRRFCTRALSSTQRRLFGVIDDLPSIRESPAALPSAPTEADSAAVVFTSGATGPSKGVRYTHGQLEAQRDALVRLYDITAEDRLVAAFAPFTLYGPAMGISSVVPEMDVAAPATLTAEALGDAAVIADATMVFASPAALANVLATVDQLTPRHRAAFAKVRLLLSAGAPVRPSLLRAALALFPNATAHTPYGMTECLPVASISLDEIDAASGGEGVCVGVPVLGVDVSIDPLDGLGALSGNLVTEPDVLGEVLVRAAHARTGYDRLWHIEFAASRPRGWHRTGDIGHLDAVGRLWIGGRLRDVISTTEGAVAPVGLEQAIESIDGVRSAAVVGIGPRGLQQVVAVIEPASPPRSPGLAELGVTDRIRDEVDENIAAVFSVPGLPVDRRHNSKIDRARVATWATAALDGGRLGKL